MGNSSSLRSLYRYDPTIRTLAQRFPQAELSISGKLYHIVSIFDLNEVSPQSFFTFGPLDIYLVPNELMTIDLKYVLWDLGYSLFTTHSFIIEAPKSNTYCHAPCSPPMVQVHAFHVHELTVTDFKYWRTRPDLPSMRLYRSHFEVWLASVQPNRSQIVSRGYLSGLVLDIIKNPNASIPDKLIECYLSYHHN